MTPEEIKARTVHLPRGRLVPRDNGTWHLWFNQPLTHGGVHPDREAALAAYAKAFPDSPDVCLECGS